MSKIDLVLLGLLMEQERHGYDILLAIEEREMTQWVGVSTQGIYKGLARLEARGLLERREESGESHPNRNVYRITESGVEQFHELAGRAIAEPVQPYFPVLWGIGFAHLLERDDLLAQLEARRNQLKTLPGLLAEHRARHQNIECPLTADAIIEYYEELIEMELNWMSRLQRRVKRTRQWPEGGCKG
jgi:DNA-binding PadR family transcriptional regulator